MPEHTLTKQEFKTRSAELNEALLDAQFELRKAGKGPVLVLISGNDLAGKAEVLHTFYAWLDNRFLHTRAFVLPVALDRRMPPLWRYWRTLPPAGELGFYLGSWYHQPLMNYSRGKLSSARFAQAMQRIVRFERLLADEGTLILKFWLHVSDEARAASAAATQPETLAMREWGDFSAADYERVRAGAQQMTELTSLSHAPWIRVPSHDARYRDIEIAQHLLQAMQSLLEPPGKLPRQRSWIPSTNELLEQIDYSKAVDKDTYLEQLSHYQDWLRQLVRHPRFARRSLLLVFEGTDAAGKGGAIRRIAECLDPRYMRVHGTRAPTEEERRHPYLMRFWRRIPAPGTVVIFDRSHYGRVLVERVEGFCSAADWQRAYGEINDFEEQLHQANTLVIKFWLATTEEEQLKRFKARDASPLKRYKLTEEDWRNREQWPAYREAVRDMLGFTNTTHAPWHLIAAEDKRYARIQTLKTVCEALQKSLE